MLFREHSFRMDFLVTAIDDFGSKSFMLGLAMIVLSSPEML